MGYYTEHDYLTEDFFDDVKSDDIIDNDVDDIEHGDSIYNFSHYIDFKFDLNFAYVKSVKGLDNMLRKYIYRHFSLFRYIKDYCVKYLKSKQIDDSQTDPVMFDSLKEMPNTKYGFDNYCMRVYFNPKDNIGFVGILKLMTFFMNMNRHLANFHYMHFEDSFYIDGNYNFSYGLDESTSVNKQVWMSKNAKKNIKHFVRVFNSTRKIQEQVEDYFDDENDFRGSRKKMYEFMSFFVNKEDDYKKCTIIVKPNSAPIVIIPENQEVHLYCIDEMPFYIEVRGTLVLHKTIFRDDTDNKILFKKFTDFYHRNVRFEIVFDNSPYFLYTANSPYFSRVKKKPSIDLSGVKIMNLDVVADDMFIDDVDELKEYVNFVNDENVKNKNFELIEI